MRAILETADYGNKTIEYNFISHKDKTMTFYVNLYNKKSIPIGGISQLIKDLSEQNMIKEAFKKRDTNYLWKASKLVLF